MNTGARCGMVNIVSAAAAMARHVHAFRKPVPRMVRGNFWTIMERHMVETVDMATAPAPRHLQHRGAAARLARRLASRLAAWGRRSVFCRMLPDCSLPVPHLSAPPSLCYLARKRAHTAVLCPSISNIPSWLAATFEKKAAPR